MKYLLIGALFAAVPGSAIMAQETRTTTTVTTQTPAANPPAVNPEADNGARPAPPAQALPSSQAEPGVPAADGVIHKWGPSETVAQAAPAPASQYPPCTRGRTDSCYNPDPSKEADVRKDGRIGG